MMFFASGIESLRFEKAVKAIARRWTDENEFDGAVVGDGFRRRNPGCGGQICILLQRIPSRGRGPGNPDGVGATDRDRERWGAGRWQGGDDGPEAAIQGVIAAAHTARIRLADGPTD